MSGPYRTAGTRSPLSKFRYALRLVRGDGDLPDYVILPMRWKWVAYIYARIWCIAYPMGYADILERLR